MPRAGDFGGNGPLPERCYPHMSLKRTRIGVCMLLLCFFGVVTAAPGGVVRAENTLIADSTYGYACIASSSHWANDDSAFAVPNSSNFYDFTLLCNVHPASGDDADMAGLVSGFNSCGAFTLHCAASANWTVAAFEGTAEGTHSCTGANSYTQIGDHGDLRRFDGTQVAANSTGEDDWPDNHFVVNIHCRGSGASGFTTAGCATDCDVTVSMQQMNSLFTLRGTSNVCGEDTHSSAGPSVGVTVCYGTSDAASFGVIPIWPDYWAGQEPDPLIPTCQELGVSYEYRRAGIAGEWEDAAAGAFPALDFGDSIRATVELVQPEDQIDHFAVFQSNPTPIRVTGDAPNYRNYFLEGFSTQLVSPLDGSWPTSLTEQVESGVGVSWFIKPGDALSQETGPHTHTFTWTNLGKSGLVPEFLVQCHVYGQDHPFEVLLPDGTGYTGGISTNSGTGCEEARVVRRAGEDTDGDWGFLLQKPASTTELQEVHWRYVPEDALSPGAWTDVSPGSLPEDQDYEAVLTIAKTSAPNPMLVEWKFVCAVAGGGTESATVGTRPPGNGLAEEGQESCYGEALDSMELTRPASWVAGAGRMATCLVEWLFVPDADAIGEEFEELQANLEEQFPFSMLFLMVDFADKLGNEIESASGTGCFDMPGSFSFGSFSTSVSDVCIGDDITVSAGQRDLLAAIVIAPLLWALCAHAVRLVSGGKS